MSTREGNTSAGPDDDHDFSKRQGPEPVTTHHEYEAKTCMVHLLRGLDGFPSWILHSSVAEQSRAKQSKAEQSIAKANARLHCLLDCVILLLIRCLPWIIMQTLLESRAL